MRRLIFTLIVLLLGPGLVWAQQNPDDKKTEPHFAAQLGPLLPNQIEGMTEIMPTWNLLYGFPYRKGHLELGGASSRGNGVEAYNGFLSYRGEVPMDDITAILYMGIDIHHYYPLGGLSPRTLFGGHVGGGFTTLLGDTVWFRGDMKFNVNPGTALYIAFGFEFKLPGGGDEGAGGAPAP